MLNFLAFAIVIAFILFIVGIINPKIVIRWGETKTRKKVFKIYGLTCIILFISFGILMPESTVPIVNSPATTVPPPVSATAKKEEVHTIAQITGNGSKQTEIYHIPAREWIISWKTEPGQYGPMNFAISVHKANGELVSIAANVIGKSEDHTVMHVEGDYYLSINTSQPYAIVIVAKY